MGVSVPLRGLVVFNAQQVWDEQYKQPSVPLRGLVVFYVSNLKMIPVGRFSVSVPLRGLVVFNQLRWTNDITVYAFPSPYGD